MAGFTCPFCNQIMSIDNTTARSYRPSFSLSHEEDYRIVNDIFHDSTVNINFYQCPSCMKTTIKLVGIGKQVNGITSNFYPNSMAKQFPEYIPKQIRNDYEESCAIVKLSPKASATLSRRCLQGMIRDFWDVHKKNLYDEISELNGKIPPDLWSALDGLRQLGNIGAHMEKDTNVIVDIDPDEAESLIALIELLIKEWYINRHERSSLFSKILTTNAQKQAEKKAK